MPDFGPYAIFIWPSLGAFALLIGGITIQTLVASRRVRRDLKRLQAEEP